MNSNAEIQTRRCKKNRMHGETPNSAGQRQERSDLLLSGLLFGKNKLFKFITSAKKFYISSPLMFCGLQTNKPQRTTETRTAADAGPNAHHPHFPRRKHLPQIKAITKQNEIFKIGTQSQPICGGIARPAAPTHSGGRKRTATPYAHLQHALQRLKLFFFDSFKAPKSVPNAYKNQNQSLLDAVSQAGSGLRLQR